MRVSVTFMHCYFLGDAHPYQQKTPNIVRGFLLYCNTFRSYNRRRMPMVNEPVRKLFGLVMMAMD